MPFPQPDDSTLFAPQKSDAAHADEQTQVRPQERDARAQPGAVPEVPGYELTREIARGGMGVVYAARDVTLDREVAIKVMLPSMSGAVFVRESRITARLPHPGIPPAHALGTLADGRPFLAMKLVKGDTLDKLLRARARAGADRGRFVVVFEQLCQAVGYAHAQGIVHRDLKPSNVMVGAFGEVQVMDWGLAKSIGGTEPEAAEPAGDGAPAADVAATVAGQVKGTPAYMAPEQARGEPVDARADVFALGGILAVMLTGKPPFVGNSVLDTIVRAAGAELADIMAALDACGADGELVSLAKRCLAARAENRPASGEDVARAVAGYREGVDARLQQAERTRAAAEARAAEELNTRREAEARADAERAKGAEQRKRRLVQLVLAGVVALVAIGSGIAANVVQKQRDSDRREADRRRADALVQALAAADTAGVPQLVTALAEYRDRTGDRLRELAAQPVTTKPGLHARLALLEEEPHRAAELADYVLACRPEELITLRQFLKPHLALVGPGLWAALTSNAPDEDVGRARTVGGAEPAALKTDKYGGAGHRVRAACALAGLAPDDPRWPQVAALVVELVVRENPFQAAVWVLALEPVRGALVPALLGRYPEARRRIGSGQLGASELVAAVGEYDLTASLLARYTSDRPADLVELAIVADARHYKEFAPALDANRAAVVPALKAELANRPVPPWWSASGLGPPLAALGGAAAFAAWLDPDPVLAERGARRGRAAAVLVALGAADAVWPLFAFPDDGDPTARSHLLARLAAVGADPLALVRRFEAERDVSARRALLVALGDFPLEVIPAAERSALTDRLLTLYRDHPDPGLHGAIDWLLRQKWGAGKELAAADTDLAAAARTAAAVPIDGAPLPAAARGKDWYVNGEGQTYAVVRGPVEFSAGSPPTETDRTPWEEPTHRMRIPRAFAVATKEVTIQQFLRFRPDHPWITGYHPEPTCPAGSVTWYDAAAYCNWLSEREGIPRA
ncbi:MAG: protein kinase, partial [Planctomycetes bacterium]|nr:protein kinase [Planctomycetota bacterium]